ncbi:MAG: isopeptide-forming domain-containing fimbrial protein [Faecalibacterium sp.]
MLPSHGLDLGYYLVDSSLGALCSLDTTHPSATIKEKNGVPAMDKKIVTGENSTSDSSTAKIGDTVNYKVTIKVAKGSSGYELTDTMSDGLTFNSSSLKVTANGADATASSDYTLDSTEHGFKLVFKDSYIGNLAENAEITVTYNATLNEKAAVGDTGNGNTNSAALTYSNNKRRYQLPLPPVLTNSTFSRLDGADHKLLNGAEFKLYDAENGGSVIKVVPVTQAVTVAANGDETGAVDTIKVNGKVHISGLDKTTYRLEETKAPTATTS